MREPRGDDARHGPDRMHGSTDGRNDRLPSGRDGTAVRPGDTGGLAATSGRRLLEAADWRWSGRIDAAFVWRSAQALTARWDRRLERVPDPVLVDDTRVLLRAQAMPPAGIEHLREEAVERLLLWQGGEELGGALGTDAMIGHAAEPGDGSRGDVAEDVPMAPARAWDLVPGRTEDALLGRGGRVRLWAGYEVVLGAATGDPTSGWFLDEGGLAWAWTLERLSVLGLLGDGGRVARETVHRASLAALAEAGALGTGAGPGAGTTAGARRVAQAAAEGLDALLARGGAARAAALLYRVPLALWVDRDPRRAMALLDAALPQLGGEARAVLAGHEDLTYALALSALGDTVGARDHLEDALTRRGVEVRQGWGRRGDRGDDGARDDVTTLLEAAYRDVASRHRTALAREMRYQYARLLWETGQTTGAAEWVAGVLAEDASYLLRCVTDPVWAQRARGLDVVNGVIARSVEGARDELLRWQQTRVGGDEELEEVQALARAISFAGEEAYPLLGAGTLIPAARRAWLLKRPRAGRALDERVAEIEAIAREVPVWLPVRLGTGFAPRFREGTGGDVPRLQRLLRERAWAEAEQLADAIEAELPLALLVASGDYLERMAEAMAAAGQVLMRQDAGTQGARAATRLAGLMSAGERVRELADLLAAAPSELGTPLRQVLTALWGDMDDVLRAWLASERSAIGEPAVRLLDEPWAIRVGEWQPFRIRVTDEAGTPVPGAVLVWSVEGQPSGVRLRLDQESACLAEDWAITREDGVAHLILHVDRVTSAAEDGHMGEALGETRLHVRLLGEATGVVVNVRVNVETVPSAPDDALPGVGGRAGRASTW